LRLRGGHALAFAQGLAHGAAHGNVIPRDGIHSAQAADQDVVGGPRAEAANAQQRLVRFGVA
jgi:hypothetical protein